MSAETLAGLTGRSLLRFALFAGTAAIFAAPAAADTLRDALRTAYDGNPTMTGQRAAVRIADENVPLARAGEMPTVEGTVTYEENVLKGDRSPGGFFSDPDRQVVGSLNARWPILTFGSVSNAIRAADARVLSSRAGLRSAESDLFTAVTGAYMDVIRDEAVVRLNQSNTQVMGYTLKESQDRNKAGEGPSSDIDQAEAREALAMSQLETARSQLIGSRENYIRLVGREPGVLEAPPPLPALPASPDEAVRIALERNPKLLAAREERRAAEYDVGVADSDALPRLDAIGNLNNYDYLGSLDPGTGPRNRDQGTTASVGVQLKVPFYSGGRISAQRRQAREKLALAMEKVTEAERLAVADVRAAYATWSASRRVIDSSRRAVAANTRAVASIKAQTDVGLRPLIDRLNAEQEQLNARVTEVTAQRDAYVAGFALLAAMGQAEATDLGLDGGALYDPVVHYDSLKNANTIGFGFGEDPAPVATGTGSTAAQNAEPTSPASMGNN